MVNPKLIALLPDLASFILVVNEGSFTAAAKQLGVTPSALSKLITRLEQALNVKLFERTTRKLIITQAGQKCMTKALRWLMPRSKPLSYLRKNMPNQLARSR